MKGFEPDYRRIIDAAKNRKTDGLPLYEHNTSLKVMGEIIGKDLTALYLSREPAALDELFRIVADFHRDYGYDTYSFEGCFTELVQGGKGLTGEAGPLFQTREEFEGISWETLPDRYFDRFRPYFDAIRRTLPENMKIVGGVGNGVFETVQDFVPYTQLAYLEVDDPDLFADLWKRTGEVLLQTWSRFLEEYSDLLAVGRFGDDLGFKSAPLLSPGTIGSHILPQYSKIIAKVHSHGHPFLLHSCGCIFSVMDRIIEETGIDAKHSNEDAIAPFSRWVEDYGHRIGNFGGLDMDFICRESEENIRSYIRKTVEPLTDAPGLAIGTGNQIADYVPPENFRTMVDEVRKIRGF